jgi:predicted RNA-binding Zn ribbon-like protein
MLWAVTCQGPFGRVYPYDMFYEVLMKEDIPKGEKGELEISDNRPPPMFIADDLGLDFLNSIGTPVNTVIEWLVNGEDLLTWLEQAKLIDAADADTIRANSFPGELDEVAAQARALREWFRGFVLAHMGRRLTAKALGLLEPLNRVLERDGGYGVIVARSAHPQNQRAPSGLEWRVLRRWSTPNALLLPIAQAMAHLVCSEDFSLVKGCEGKTCTLLFLDTTHGRARRWCSMTICGNRAKQAAHRHRSTRKSRPRLK